MPTSSDDRHSIASLETKLIEYFDKRLVEIKDEIHALALNSASKNEVDSLAAQVNHLQSQSDVNTQRIVVLEGSQNADEKDRRQRPVQVWQIVVGGFAVLFGLATVAYDVTMFLFQVVVFILTYYKK